MKKKSPCLWGLKKGWWSRLKFCIFYIKTKEVKPSEFNKAVRGVGEYDGALLVTSDVLTRGSPVS